MTRKAFNPAALAALASGITLSAAHNLGGDTSAAPTAEQLAAAALKLETEAAAATAAAAAASTTDTTAEAEAAAAATAAAGKEVTPGVGDITVYLQKQVAEKDGALLAANVELTNVKAKVADYEASFAGLKAIAAASINNMRVALSGPKLDLSASSATEILAQHEAAKKDFETKFVSGGVAAVDAAQDTNAAANQGIDSKELARLDAVLGHRG